MLTVLRVALPVFVVLAIATSTVAILAADDRWGALCGMFWALSVFALFLYGIVWDLGGDRRY